MIANQESLVLEKPSYELESISIWQMKLVLYVGLGALVFLFAMRQLRAVTREDIDLMSDFLGPKMKFISRWLGEVLDIE